MNTILKSWYEKGIHTPQEIALKDVRTGGDPPKSSGSKRRTSSYDLDEFDRRGFNIPKIDK